MTYGTSIKLNDKFDFDFDPDSKSLSLIAEEENLGQSIKVLLSTFEGQNILYPTFGTKLYQIGSADVPAYFVEGVIRKAVSRDPRVKAISSISVEKLSNNWAVDITIVTQERAKVDLRSVIRW